MEQGPYMTAAAGTPADADYGARVAVGPGMETCEIAAKRRNFEKR